MSTRWNKYFAGVVTDNETFGHGDKPAITAEKRQEMEAVKVAEQGLRITMGNTKAAIDEKIELGREKNIERQKYINILLAMFRENMINQAIKTFEVGGQ